jgi:hypothetical protein
MKICQSCSMPLDKDPKGGGTNADGSKSETFCSYCWQEGKFAWPDATAKQMQEFVKDKLRQGGAPAVAAWAMTRMIPKLERWRKA